jgi:enoyl-CoA hydratase
MTGIDSRVLLEITDGVAVVTLDDPRRRNALDLAICDEVAAVFDEIESRRDVGAVVVTGGGSAFCAGADLSHLKDSARDGLLAIYEGFMRVARTPLPTIAAVNGPAVGAGMNLALVCDVRIVAESARFDTRFLDLGVHPGGGHTWMLQRAAGREAAFATVVFGEVLTGHQIVASGLAWKCVPDADLLAAARALGARAANAPRELVLRTKRTIDDVASMQDHLGTMHRELDDQVWSVGQPAFRERLAALQARVSAR